MEWKAGARWGRSAAGWAGLDQPAAGTPRHVGPLLIVAHYLRRLGVRQIVDAAVPPRGKPLASPGAIPAVLTANPPPPPSPLYSLPPPASPPPVPHLPVLPP